MDTVRGIPIETLLQVYDERQRFKERQRETRKAHDRAYRQAHADERRAYNKQYYQAKKQALQADPNYAPPRRGRPKAKADPLKAQACGHLKN